MAALSFPSDKSSRDKGHAVCTVAGRRWVWIYYALEVREHEREGGENTREVASTSDNQSGEDQEHANAICPSAMSLHTSESWRIQQVAGEVQRNGGCTCLVLSAENGFHRMGEDGSVAKGRGHPGGECA